MSVVNGDRKCVRRDDALLVQFTERAALLSKRMPSRMARKLVSSPAPLLVFAQPAEALQVVGIVAVAMFEWTHRTVGVIKISSVNENVATREVLSRTGGAR
jgi:hypothetical protein